MTIPVPTIDQFNETTVMTVIRNVVDYIIGLVPQINNGDITDMSMNYQGSTLTINLIKGDGTQISKNVTIESGGGETNPYPTDVSLSLSGSTLNCDIILSNNNHVTGTVDLSPLVPSVTGFVTEEELQQVQSDLQEQITGIKPTVTVNQDVSPPTITVMVNGISSTANLPSTSSTSNIYRNEVYMENVSEYTNILNVVKNMNIGTQITFGFDVNPNNINEYYLSFAGVYTGIKTVLDNVYIFNGTGTVMMYDKSSNRISDYTIIDEIQLQEANSSALVSYVEILGTSPYTFVYSSTPDVIGNMLY